MPIDSNFPKNHKVIGKRTSADGMNFYLIWGPGREAEAASNENVRKDYSKRGEPIEPLGVHGTALQLIGIRVLQMEVALRSARSRSTNGIERKMTFQQLS